MVSFRRTFATVQDRGSRAPLRPLRAFEALLCFAFWTFGSLFSFASYISKGEVALRSFSFSFVFTRRRGGPSLIRMCSDRRLVRICTKGRKRPLGRLIVRDRSGGGGGAFRRWEIEPSGAGLLGALPLAEAG